MNGKVVVMIGHMSNDWKDITHNNNNLTLNSTQSLKHTTTTICHPFVQTLHTFHNNTLSMNVHMWILSHLT